MHDQDPGPQAVASPNGDDDRPIAQLLRVAGKRPEAPAEDAARVRAAAHAQWQRVVADHHRRRRARRLGVGLLATAAAVALAFGIGLVDRDGNASTPTVVATLEAVTHPEALPESWRPGATFAVGDVLDTSTHDPVASPRLALRLPGGTSIRLDTDSRLTLRAADRVVLDRGGLYVDATGDQATLHVVTPGGVAHDLGTQFEVRLLGPTSDQVRIRVREGAVALQRDGEVTEVGVGEQITMQPDGRVARQSIVRHGAPWAWTTEIRPPFDAEAGSLLTYVTWMAREQGWHLAVSPAHREELASIRPFGQLDGLSLETAAAAWLEGAGFRGRLDDDTYRISAGD